jgi:phosphate-selective porin OprO/OprP
MDHTMSVTAGKGQPRRLRRRCLSVLLTLSFLLGALPPLLAQAPPGGPPAPVSPGISPSVAPPNTPSYPAGYIPRPSTLQAPTAQLPTLGPPSSPAPPPNLDPATRAWIEQLVSDRLKEEKAKGYPVGSVPDANATWPTMQSAAQGPYGADPPVQQPGAPTMGTASSNPWDGLPYSLDFKDGVLFKTNDGMFSLRFNNLLQVDYRDFSHTAQGVHTATSLQDNFTIARWWVYLTGNVTEFVDYQTVFAAGAANSGIGPANVNILDAFLDFNPFGKDAKEYFQIRVGRMKTPFLYQFYKLSPSEFITPELSMFSTNFLQNRQLGIMAHGLLFDKRVDYAAGVFNGVPNSFDVVQSDREGVFYLGLYPFVNEKDSIFKNLILVGSGAFGEHNGFADPVALGTAVPSNGPPNNLLISPTFLVFNPTATHTGMHYVWAAEVIWAIRSFNLYAEYTGGLQRYGLTTAPGANFPVSLSGYSIAATYFLTGEEITPDRRRVKPLQPYNWKCGGLGAFEVFGRFSNLVLGSSVFADKLANPDIFANRVNATDFGVNWYLNEYIKLVFDWQHAWFNHDVSLTAAPGGNMTKQEDIFWWRFQLYY